MRWLILVILLPLSALSQEKKEVNLSGLWTGTLFNEVTKKTLHYEIVISGKNDNYSGYSYTTFQVDTFTIVGVKAIKVIHKETKVFFDDEYWVLNKSKVEPPSGVRQVTSLRISMQDTMMFLNGNFFTTLTREHRKRVSGAVKLQKTRDRKNSELMHILDSLGISKNLAFYDDEPTKDTVATAPPPKKDTTAVVPPPPVEKELPAPPLLIGNNETHTLASVRARPLSKRQPKGLISIIKQLDIVVVDDKPEPPPPPVVKPVKKDTVVIKPAPKKDTIAAKPPPPPPPKEEKKEQIEGLAKRTVETIRIVDVFADSIKLDLYDNGYVDGDSISIIVNGRVVLEHQLLSTRPITKWIYLTPDLGDEIRIIMYAENLGTIAPNTGLLSVSDGPTRYDILFSGDLKQNASIILKRKKK